MIPNHASSDSSESDSSEFSRGSASSEGEPSIEGEPFDRERTLKALGRAVRRRRENLGLSQEALSARAGLHENYVGGVERGERNTSIINVLKLTGALELRPAELMSRFEAELRLMDEIEE